MKHIFIAAALALSMNSHAATQDLDQLLSKIEADINAQRLAKPAGNNALEGINAFRAQAPFDYRITPLIFKVGESYVALANKAIDKKDFTQAQAYLDTAWKVAALTPGLEAAQERNDKLSNGKSSSPKVVSQGPSKAELKKQKALADAAAAERKRIDAERRKKQNADKKAKAAAAKKAAADKKAKEAAERQRRIANEKLQKQKEAAAKINAQQQQAKKQLAAKETEVLRLKKLAEKKAEKKAEKAVVKIAKADPAKKVERKSAPIKIGDESPIGNGVETSAPIASYPLPQEMISNRDRASIKQNLVPICKAIIDNDASVVLHAESKSDYRWLAVRLTLCTRRLDSSFRLRHSFEETSSDPSISLHPPRNSALIGDF